MKILFKQIVGEKNIEMAVKLRSSIKGYFSKEKYSVLLDTTNGCNLKCAFCTRQNDKVLHMTTEDLDIILGKIHKHIGAMQLSCAWEYSIAKNAAEIIRTMGKYNIPTTTIYTNGNILTDDIAEALIDSRLNDFVVSIGEMKKETYEKLRKGGKFERVVSNIRKLDSLKKERNSQLPRICTNLTVVNSNIGELVEFVDLVRNLGVERIIGRHLILNKGLDMDNEIVKDKARANGIIATAEKKALGYGMSFSIPRFVTQRTSKACRAPWNQIYLSSNGDVSVCPRIHRYTKIGNLLTESFKSIITGHAMSDLRRQFKDCRFDNPVCSVCMDNLENEVAIDQGF